MNHSRQTSRPTQRAECMTAAGRMQMERGDFPGAGRARPARAGYFTYIRFRASASRRLASKDRRDASTQVSAKPIHGQTGGFLQRAGLFKQMGGARNNL